METLDAWEGVHPGIVTLPMEWNYAMPYGVVYAKEPALHVARFVGAIAQGARAASGAVRWPGVLTVSMRENAYAVLLLAHVEPFPPTSDVERE